MKLLRSSLNDDHHGKQCRENSGSEQIAEVEGHRDRIPPGFALRGGDSGNLVRYSRTSLSIYHREYLSWSERQSRLKIRY